MTKLRFDSLTTSMFSFKLIPKKKTIKHDGNKKLTTKLVRGICIKNNDIYKIRVDVKSLKPNIIDNSQPDLLVLEFTKDSYNLRGVITVFSKNKNEHGHYVRYIRNASYCKFFPGSEETLVPFCPNWICSGYIVRQNGKLMFEFNDCICPDGYNTFEKDDDE